jgi:hypothetical protein
VVLKKDMAAERFFIFVILGISLTASACTSRHPQSSAAQEAGEQQQLVSFVKMGDANASDQLVAGFYGIESGSWRWTSGHFSVVLRVPPAAQNGATVTLSLFVPEPVLQRLKSVALTASVAGQALHSSQYSTSGPSSFTADVPAGLLTKDTVKVDFALDKSVPPGAMGDQRELGIIANSVGLTAR